MKNHIQTLADQKDIKMIIFIINHKLNRMEVYLNRILNQIMKIFTLKYCNNKIKMV